MRIRRIEPTDGHLLRETRLSAIRDSPGDTTATVSQTESFDDGHWDAAAEANSSGATQATFFAEDDGVTDRVVTIGMVGAYVTGDMTATMVGLWSAPGYRDIGVADALLEAVVEWATGSGAERLRFWVVERNELARLFYESRSFAPTGQTMAYEPDPRVSEVEMIRVLAVDPASLR